MKTRKLNLNKIRIEMFAEEKRENTSNSIKGRDVSEFTLTFGYWNFEYIGLSILWHQKYFELSTLPLKIHEFIPRFGI